MSVFGKHGKNADLKSAIGLTNLGNQFWNLTPAELVEDTIINGQGVLTDTGAIAIETGEFTGRSPKDRFIVKDNLTKDTVWWGDINIPFKTDKFNSLYEKAMKYLENKDIYVRDVYACSIEKFRLKIRVINEYPWSNHFVSNMFHDLKDEEIKSFIPQWHIINIPGFKADPELDGTRKENFSIIEIKARVYSSY